MRADPPHCKSLLEHYALAARMCSREFNGEEANQKDRLAWQELGVNQLIGLLAYALSDIDESVSIHPFMMIRVGLNPTPTPYTLSMGHVAQCQGVFLTPLGFKTQSRLAQYLHPEKCLRPQGSFGPEDTFALQEHGVNPLEALSYTDKEVADVLSQRFSYWVREAQARSLRKLTQTAQGTSGKTRL